jgi:isocitrate dehydrogenase
MPSERLVLRPPERGHKILVSEAGLRVPDDPIIPLIEGDGIGPEVVRAAVRAVDEAVEVSSGGRRKIAWYPVPAGEKAMFQYGEMLPEATLAAIREYVVALKGPMTTPVGGGFRSLNVTIRKTLDLYANMRPISWIPGIPSPVTHPERLDIVIFREGTEDVYAGIEWEEGSAEARRMIEILEKEFKTRIRPDSGIGVKPISETGSKRLVRKAIRYAIQNGRKSVTLVHKGNIMKFTEGAFRAWGYEVAADEFGDYTISWDETVRKYDGKAPADRILIKDVIADNMFQQLLTRPEEYDILATTNLNGDYLSDAAAGQIGGIGVAAGGNLGDAHGVFEPVHGSVPKYAGMDKVNPTAEILAGGLMLDYLGWKEAANRLRDAIRKVIASKLITYDLARQLPEAKQVATSVFAQAVVDAIHGAPR